MKRYTTVVAVAAQLLLASTFVLIESLSTRNLVAKTPSRTRFQSSSSSSSRNYNKLVSSRYASSLSRINDAFSSRLFSSSDMSSHPYSVYYGSSGSTAAQNFDQHDHANDVYGYGSRSHNDREGGGEQEGAHRNIQSVQDRSSLVGGRRGAQLFGTNYIGTNQNNNIIYNNDPPPRHVEENHGRSFIEEEDMYMDNLHMMDHQLDRLLHERDNLRRHVDDLVGDNIYLQQHPYHHYHPHHDTNLLPRPSNRNHREEYQSTKDAIDSVMTELKNMQKMLQPLQPIESQQVLNNNNSNNNDNNVDAGNHNKAPSVESLLTELRSIHKSIQNFGIEQQRQHQEQQQQQRSLNSNIDNDVNTNNTNDSIRGGDASPHQSPPPPVHDIGGTQQPQHHNFEVTLKGSTAENIFGSGNSISGEYVVVINAEMKHKTETITSSAEEQGGGIREFDEYHYPNTNYNGGDNQLLDATNGTV
jgi:hypothetical protein